MLSNRSMSRAAVAALVLVGVAAGSGCSWFRKGNDLYAQAPEMRPLEVPPDLDAPRTDTAVNVPTPATALGNKNAGVGFTVPGTRDDVFAKVGTALGAVEGVTITSSAQAMGVYDVNYEGSNFLVRVAGADVGAYVAAVDPRGVPATGDAPKKLIETLRTAMVGR
ncbi:hypothetical protein [Lysobacter sp. TAF61]|uniref:hypothetical protein n=1 Tax=Lysobacter sp. TAF61 TaxID=3233072 RepID=UPI003F9BE8E0